MVTNPFRWTFIAPGAPHFTDVPQTQQFYTPIEVAYSKNLISGYTQQQCLAAGAVYPCFRPNDFITRGQMARLVSQATALNDDVTGRQTYHDVPPGSYAYVYVERLAIHGMILGGTSNPGENGCPPAPGNTLPCYNHAVYATRGQIAYALFIASNGPYNGMFAHIATAGNAPYEGSNNYDYNIPDGNSHTSDPLIPAGQMDGTVPGFWIFRPNAENVEWTPSSVTWLNTHQYDNGGHWMPAIVFHVFDSWSGGNNSCVTGYWDTSQLVSTLPGFQYYLKSSCFMAAQNEIRIYPDPNMPLSSLQPTPFRHYTYLWWQSTGDNNTKRQINIDNYRINADTQDNPINEFMGKFCLSHLNGGTIYWCP